MQIPSAYQEPYLKSQVTIASPGWANMDPWQRIAFEAKVYEALGDADITWHVEEDGVTAISDEERRHFFFDMIEYEGRPQELVTANSLGRYAVNAFNRNPRGMTSFADFLSSQAAISGASLPRLATPRLATQSRFPQYMGRGVFLLGVNDERRAKGQNWKRVWGMVPRAFVHAVDWVEQSDIRASVAGYGRDSRTVMRVYSRHIQPLLPQRTMPPR